ncbi:MAG: ROK family protein [Calditrichaeota bacterium]|nr:ROK family protein [Calditrichota bacterium]
MSVYVGLDIGGTKFMVGAGDENGNLLHSVIHETPQRLEEGIELLKKMTREIAGSEKILGMGAAIGGPLNWKKGIVSPLHQPEWRDVPLKKIMEKEFGCPFFVDVDTNVAAWAEYKSAQPRPEKLLYMTISTGIGGGFIADGKNYRGKDGAHPEIGHQSIPFRCGHPERVQCECGAPDCLEALVSGNGIQRIYGKKAENLNDAEWEEVAYNLGQGLRNLAALYLPDVIVLGGGIATGAREKFFNQALKVMKDHLKMTPAPEVRISKLGYNTALMGAIYIARDGLN